MLPKKSPKNHSNLRFKNPFPLHWEIVPCLSGASSSNCLFLDRLRLFGPAFLPFEASCIVRNCAYMVPHSALRAFCIRHQNTAASEATHDASGRNSAADRSQGRQHSCAPASAYRQHPINSVAYNPSGQQKTRHNRRKASFPFGKTKGKNGFRIAPASRGRTPPGGTAGKTPPRPVTARR